MVIMVAGFGLDVWAANALQAASGEREDLGAQQIDRVDLHFQCREVNKKPQGCWGSRSIFGARGEAAAQKQKSPGG
jgi:hypothetical protein